MDYRRMYDDSEMLYAYDLEAAGGRDVVVVISKVYAGELTGEKGRKSKKPFVQFEGRDKKLALNKTNGKAIATMYGKDTAQWPGKPIAIYATTTEYNGEQRDCIRIRPRAPEMPQRKGNGSKSRGGQQAQPDVAQQIADEMAKGDGSLPPGADPDVDAAAARDDESDVPS